MHARGCLTWCTFFSLIVLLAPAYGADVPDLNLEKIMVTPAPAVSGEQATLSVEVKNIGTAKSRAVTLFFHGDEKALQAFGIPMAYAAEHGVPMPEIPPGQSFQYTSAKKISLSPGNYTIQAVIWPGNKPQAKAPMPGAETNLYNNEGQVQFTVKAGAVQIQKGGIHTLPPEKYKLIEPKKPGPVPPDPPKGAPGVLPLPADR